MKRVLREVNVPVPMDALEEAYTEAADEFTLTMPRSYWMLEGSLYRKSVRTAAFHILAEIIEPGHLVVLGKDEVHRSYVWRRLGQEVTGWSVVWVGTVSTDHGPLVLLEKAARP